MWAGGRKIASIGLAVRKWVTYHGVSLNVDKDLSLFSCMHLCGLEGVEPTSVNLERERQGLAPVPMSEVKDGFRRACEALAAASVA